MQINADRVTQLRKKRSWSQDELATAAGLNLRTVQRVEASGSASLQTLKAIAATFEVDLDLFITHPEKVMVRYEYKTLVMPFKWSVFKQSAPDISSALNQEGRDGWRLRQVFSPVGSMGNSENVIAILERPAG